MKSVSTLEQGDTFQVRVDATCHNQIHFMHEAQTSIYYRDSSP